jgi:hypothetical protein
MISLRTELLKTKRTAAFYLTLVAAAFGPFMSLLDLIFGEGVSEENGKVIFNEMFIQKFQMTSFVMLPMFVVLICTLLPQIEYKNNAWKQVLTSPQTKGNVFLAKFINIHLLILLFLIVNQLCMLVTVVILHFKEPSLNVLNQPVNWHKVLVTILNIYVALLAMSTIQFWLGLRFKNFIVPIAVGISCWIIGVILVEQFQSSFAAYFPYSFHVFGTFPDSKAQLNNILWTSAGYAVLFLVLGFIDFKRRGNRS